MLDPETLRRLLAGMSGPRLPPLQPGAPKVFDLRPGAAAQRPATPGFGTQMSTIEKIQQGLAGLFGNPGASASQLRNYGLQTGLSLLAQKDRPGSLGGALGQTLGYQQQRGAVDQATAGLPPQLQAALSAMPTAQAAAMAAQLALPPPPEEPKILPQGAIMVDSSGNRIAENTPEAKNALPVSAQEFDYLRSLPDEAARQAYIEFRRKSPLVQVNTAPTPPEKAIDAEVSGALGQRSTVRDKVNSISNLDEALAIASDDEFKKVTGLVGGTVGDVLARAGANPEAAKLAQRFDLLQSGIALDILRNFTGAKSDYEYQVASRMASGDRTLTAEQLKVGINFLKREAIKQAQNWAEDILYYADNPQTFNIGDERIISRQVALAEDIMRRFRDRSPRENDQQGMPGRTIPEEFRRR